MLFNKLEFSVEKFVSSGLMKKEYDKVKLHATLLNTLFRKDEGDIGDKFVSKVNAVELGHVIWFSCN